MMKWLKHRRLAISVCICLLLILFLRYLSEQTILIERDYSRVFYPVYSYLPKILFQWIPWSVGDILYAVLGMFLIVWLIKPFIFLFRKQYRRSWRYFLRFIVLLLGTYLFFQVSWGLQYYRVPISRQLNLKVDTVLLADHLQLLDEQIVKVNTLRGQFNMAQVQAADAEEQVAELMKQDTLFPMLSKTQVKIKGPLSSTVASYFGVSGYFNPFTHEAHINRNMPKTSYPFTVAHELSHQMGIGFEDECNFIAYVKLRDDSRPWFAYAAYYESVSYLLRSLYLVDKSLFESYKGKLSAQIIEDLKADRLFWDQYSGWITHISGMFYNQYLIHNNQAEGMARYGMVSRLIIAYETQKKATN